MQLQTNDNGEKIRLPWSQSNQGLHSWAVSQEQQHTHLQKVSWETVNHTFIIHTMTTFSKIKAVQIKQSNHSTAFG